MNQAMSISHTNLNMRPNHHHTTQDVFENVHKKIDDIQKRIETATTQQELRELANLVLLLGEELQRTTSSVVELQIELCHLIPLATTRPAVHQAMKLIGQEPSKPHVMKLVNKPQLPQQHPQHPQHPQHKQHDSKSTGHPTKQKRRSTSKTTHPKTKNQKAQMTSTSRHPYKNTKKRVRICKF